MEIESALVANPTVAEAAVVGRADETTGEVVIPFVVLKGPRPEGDEAERIAGVLRAWVGKEIGPIAKPKEIRFGTICQNALWQDHAPAVALACSW